MFSNFLSTYSNDELQKGAWIGIGLGFFLSLVGLWYFGLPVYLIGCALGIMLGNRTGQNSIMAIYGGLALLTILLFIF